MGRAADAGAQDDKGEVQERASPERRAHLLLSARNYRDGQPGRNAQSRGRRGARLRFQPAFHSGRRSGEHGEAYWRFRLRSQGRGREPLLRAHREGARIRAQPDDGRRGRPCRGAAHDRSQAVRWAPPESQRLGNAPCAGPQKEADGCRDRQAPRRLPRASSA